MFNGACFSRQTRCRNHIDARDAEGLSIEQIATQFSRLSRDSLAQGVLDKLGTEIFTTGKVRKALDLLFGQAPPTLIRLIRKTISDSSVTPTQIQEAISRIWDGANQQPFR